MREAPRRDPRSSAHAPASRAGDPPFLPSRAAPLAPLACAALARPQVIQGLEDVVLEMLPGQEVQALIPAALAYGVKGVCAENGECLIPSNTNLKYFIRLKKIAILPS